MHSTGVTKRIRNKLIPSNKMEGNGEKHKCSLKVKNFVFFNTFQSAIMWSQKPSLFKLKEQIFIHGNYYAPLF